MTASMVAWQAGRTTVPGYLALPERMPAPGVIVVQEWWGLEPHIKEVADRLAARGFVALVPDLYHGRVAAEPDEARKLAMALDQERAVAEINSAAAYLLDRDDVLPPGVGIVGFCMGGGLALLTACHSGYLGATVVFYGHNPRPLDQVRDLSCPLLGLYGGRDRSIPAAQVDALRAALTRYGKTFDIVVYPDAPHAFFNDTRPAYRPDAAAAAWRRTVDWFHRYLSRAA